MSTRALGRHTRPKKLGPKQNVQIFRESDVDLRLDLDASRGGSTVETGVEKAEESVCCQDDIASRDINQFSGSDSMLTNTYRPGIPPSTSDKCDAVCSLRREVQRSTHTDTANHSERCSV